MSTLLQPRLCAPSCDVGAFVNKVNRLPRLGDNLAPWHYRGWLLAYVILIHERCSSVNNRWGYHLRIFESGELLDEPIPQIAFGSPDKRIASMLHEWSGLIGRDCGGWSDFRSLLDWLLWGLALSKEEPRLTEQVNEKPYRKVNVGPLLEHPYDYLGDLVAQGKARGWNPTAFFPTPHNVVELMVSMTMADHRADGHDPRTLCVNDPCVGSGRMLLHASNFSLNLFGQDIDPLAVAMCKINGALYAPWLAFPLPSSVLGARSPGLVSDSDSTETAVPLLRVDDREQRAGQDFAAGGFADRVAGALLRLVEAVAEVEVGPEPRYSARNIGTGTARWLYGYKRSYDVRK